MCTKIVRAFFGDHRWLDEKSLAGELSHSYAMEAKLDRIIYGQSVLSFYKNVPVLATASVQNDLNAINDLVAEHPLNSSKTRFTEPQCAKLWHDLLPDSTKETVLFPELKLQLLRLVKVYIESSLEAMKGGADQPAETTEKEGGSDETGALSGTHASSETSGPIPAGGKTTHGKNESRSEKEPEDVFVTPEATPEPLNSSRAASEAVQTASPISESVFDEITETKSSDEKTPEPAREPAEADADRVETANRVETADTSNNVKPASENLGQATGPAEKPEDRASGLLEDREERIARRRSRTRRARLTPDAEDLGKARKDEAKEEVAPAKEETLLERIGKRLLSSDSPMRLLVETLLGDRRFAFFRAEPPATDVVKTQPVWLAEIAQNIKAHKFESNEHVRAELYRMLANATLAEQVSRDEVLQLFGLLDEALDAVPEEPVPPAKRRRR